MWSVEKHIQKKEIIKYEGTPEYIGYFWWFVLGLITISTIFIPLLILLLVYLNKNSTKYIITNMRVARRKGIISEDFKSSTFKHMTSVSTKQGIIGKLFNFGTLTIDTSGSGSSVEFNWKYVKDPIQIKNKIEKNIS